MRSASLAAIALVAAAAMPAQAQVRSFTLCQNSTDLFCAALDVTLVSPSQLRVELSNTGNGGLNSFLSGFGLFGLSGYTATLQSAGFYEGATLVQDLLAANSGGNNDPFAEAGAPADLQSGAGTQALQLGADFTNDGFRPCGFGDATSGGARRFATCAGERGVFEFVLNAPISAATFTQIGVAVRAQGLGPNGQGSDKCFSADDRNCTVTVETTGVVPEPSTYVLMASGLVGVAGLGALRRRHG